MKMIFSASFVLFAAAASRFTVSYVESSDQAAPEVSPETSPKVSPEASPEVLPEDPAKILPETPPKNLPEDLAFIRPNIRPSYIRPSDFPSYIRPDELPSYIRPEDFDDIRPEISGSRYVKFHTYNRYNEVGKYSNSIPSRPNCNENFDQDFNSFYKQCSKH